MSKINRKAYYRTKIANTILGFFFKGLLVVVPFWVCGFVIYWILTSLDGIIVLESPIPGLGILIVLVGITLIGIMVNYLVTDPINRFFNSVLDKFPVMKMIYSTIRDFMEAFVGDQKKFTEPVYVEMSTSGIKKVGFITQKDLSVLGLDNHVGVYFPHSYNFSGNYFLVPADKIHPIKANSAEVMKHVVSGGVGKLESEVNTKQTI